MMTLPDNENPTDQAPQPEHNTLHDHKPRRITPKPKDMHIVDYILSMAVSAEPDFSSKGDLYQESEIDDNQN